jgi:predicted nucleic acid-binding protein
MLVSVPLILEYEAVLTSPEHLREFALTAAEAGSILDAIAMVAERVSFHFLWRPQLKDPSDEMVLGTAVNGGADYLATFNLRHLRDAAGLFGIEAAVPGRIWSRTRSRCEKKQRCPSSADVVIGRGQARG